MFVTPGAKRVKTNHKCCWDKFTMITLRTRRPQLLSRAGQYHHMNKRRFKTASSCALMIYRVKRPYYSSEIPIERLLFRSVLSVKQLIRVP